MGVNPSLSKLQWKANTLVLSRKSIFSVPFFSVPKSSFKCSFTHVPSNRTHIPRCPVDYRGLRAIMVLLRGLSSTFRMDRFFWWPLFARVCAFAGAECLFSAMMDSTSHRCAPVWLSCHIFLFVLGRLHVFFVCHFSISTTTITTYFLWKSNMPFLINREYCVNSSRGLSVADADIFARLIQSLSHLSRNC